MTEIEARIQSLQQQLAWENRCLLFMLYYGYTLPEAEGILIAVDEDEGGPTATGDDQGVALPQANTSQTSSTHHQVGRT